LRSTAGRFFLTLDDERAMDTTRALLVDAFTTEPLAGNVAGVVPDATGLSDDQLARIAAELGASETAFVTPAATTDGIETGYRVRYFTPSAEVDLCGHATVAAFAARFDDGAIDAGEHPIHTNAGTFSVRVTDTGRVWMRQDAPRVTPVDVDLDRLATALGVDAAALRDVGADLPAAVASTGLPFLVVPVNFLERLTDADPDHAAVEALSDEFDVAGVYAFTFDTLSASATLHGRAFAPAVGVPEDPVTGTASGAAAGYLRTVDAFDGDPPDEFVLEQGHVLDRPGRVHVRLTEPTDAAADDAVRVSVGGDAVVALDATLRVPPATDDDIVEA
jgi:PhzF family phenazine biosynthesis protein